LNITLDQEQGLNVEDVRVQAIEHVRRVFALEVFVTPDYLRIDRA
jgi:hypothetical protein